MPEPNPCLVILFNHKYDKNIETLERLYSPRFRNIFFLVPFYTGTKPNVIPVYESSYYFQGYFAQGLSTFYRPEFTHYLFIGDDLILNPSLTEKNYSQLIGLDVTTSYIPDLKPLHEVAKSLYIPGGDEKQAFWSHTFQGVTFYANRSGSETRPELPTANEAAKRLAEYGVHVQPLSYFNVFGPISLRSSWQQPTRTLKSLWKYYVTWRRFKVPGQPGQLQLEYPLAYSYSDIVIVAATSIKEFCHLCGVFSAMGLFVEMAVPTALALCGATIKTDGQALMSGKPVWLPADIEELGLKYAYNLAALMADFPAQQLYHHPVKLSKWK